MCADAEQFIHLTLPIQYSVSFICINYTLSSPLLQTHICKAIPESSKATKIMATYLVTGSSRGLGLKLVAHLLAHPSDTVGTIFATARSDASIELKELVDGSAGRVQFVKLDVTDKVSIKEAAGQVKSLLGENKGVDVLINNAGIMNWTNDGIHAM